MTNQRSLFIRLHYAINLNPPADVEGTRSICGIWSTVRRDELNWVTNEGLMFAEIISEGIPILRGVSRGRKRVYWDVMSLSPIYRVAISFDLSSGNVRCCQWLDVKLLRVQTTRMGPFTWPEKQDSFSLQQSINLPQPNWAVCQSDFSYPATHVLSPDNLESRIIVESPFSAVPTWNWKSHPDGWRYACVWKCSCLTSDPGGKKMKINTNILSLNWELCFVSLTHNFHAQMRTST